MMKSQEANQAVFAIDSLRMLFKNIGEELAP
jgi:hypothetical protein